MADFTPMYVTNQVGLAAILAPSLRYDLVIPGEPVTKARPKVFRGRGVTPKKTRDAEQAIAWLFRQKYGPNAPWLEDPIGAIIECYMESRKGKDWDNLGKLPCDALNGIAYKDDSYIRMGHVEVYVPDDMVPGVRGLRMRKAGDPTMYDGHLAKPHTRIRLYQLSR